MWQLRRGILSRNAADGVIAVYATLDGTTSNVTLSNGNLTATHDNTTTNSGARSTTLKNSGKLYFECTITDLEGANDGLGLLTSAGTLTNICTNGTNCIAVYKSGNIYSNDAYTTRTLGAMGDGDVVQYCIDLDLDEFWVRRQTVNWNSDGAANPATGVGGLSCSSYSGTTLGPAVCFGGAGSQAGDNVTFNFGASAFVHSVPSGFTAGWPV